MESDLYYNRRLHLNCIIVKNVLVVSNRIYYLFNFTVPKNWCEVV